MDEGKITTLLQDLPLRKIEYYGSIGSTNDRAGELAAAGGPDLSLILADEQTRGRGRAGRTWFTPPGSALAFTLILHPQKEDILPAHYTGLGALAVCRAIEEIRLDPKIKWPNDVILGGRKVCGVLAEAQWLGNDLQAILLGIGINIAPQSVPPDTGAALPATCVEAAAGRKIDRWAFLRSILMNLIESRKLIGGEAFTQAWEKRLAYKGRMIQVLNGGVVRFQGTIIGLSNTGALRLQMENGQEKLVDSGEIQVRPLVDSKAN